MEAIQRLKDRDRTDAEAAWREYLERRNALVATYGTDQGRRTFRNLLERTFFLETTINPKPDAMTYVREAQRNVSLELISHIPGIAAQVIADWLLDMEVDIQRRLELERGNG